MKWRSRWHSHDCVKLYVDLHWSHTMTDSNVGAFILEVRRQDLCTYFMPPLQLHGAIRGSTLLPTLPKHIGDSILLVYIYFLLKATCACVEYREFGYMEIQNCTKLPLDKKIKPKKKTHKKILFFCRCRYPIWCRQLHDTLWYRQCLAISRTCHLPSPIRPAPCVACFVTR